MIRILYIYYDSYIFFVFNLKLIIIKLIYYIKVKS